MAKPIVLSFKGQESRFDFKKLDRSKLYGKRKRVVLDHTGQPCERAQLTSDGALLLRSGMTSQGYFDERGRQVDRSELVGVDSGGREYQRFASTLGVAQEVTGPVQPEELLDLAIISVYMLEPQELDAELAQALEAGQLFRFDFNYYADFHVETGILLHNQEGYFAMIGTPLEPVWCAPDAAPEADFEEASLDDDLDFEMF